MTLEREERDEKNISYFKEDDKMPWICPDEGRCFSIECTVKDRALAELFLRDIICRNFTGDNDSIEKLTGLQFSQITYDKRNEALINLSNLLQSTLDEINSMR